MNQVWYMPQESLKMYSAKVTIQKAFLIYQSAVFCSNNTSYPCHIACSQTLAFCIVLLQSAVAYCIFIFSVLQGVGEYSQWNSSSDPRSYVGVVTCLSTPHTFLPKRSHCFLQTSNVFFASALPLALPSLPPVRHMPSHLTHLAFD